MYAHNISTLMLSEVSGMVEPERQKRIGEALSKALRVTLNAQAVRKSEANRGGWRYQPNSPDSDLSHSGWALMALRSARNNGAPVPKEAIDDAVGFIMRCRSHNGAFGYTPGAGGSLAMTGVGLLCLELSGQHRTEVTIAAGDFIAKNFKMESRGGRFFYYMMYYCAQSMFQLGEKHWEEFAPQLYEALLAKQNEDGSWNPGGAATTARAPAIAPRWPSSP